MMAKTVLSVPDISCDHCKATITNVLAPVAGVRAVDVDVPTKRVSVDYDAATVGVERLKELLAEEDYPVAAVESPA